VKILKIQILTRQHFADHVMFFTDLPSPTPGLSSENLDLQTRVAAGQGKEYCEKHFPGIPLELISG
jgi:hypothetical protein